MYSMFFSLFFKTPPRYELCSAESGNEYCQNQDKKMFFVKTSDEENNVLNNKNRSVDRHGVYPYGRHSHLPVRRRGAWTPKEERYFTDTPQLDRHSAFDHRFLLLS